MIDLLKTPTPIQVGDSLDLWANQSPRPARVVAVRKDGLQCVIEYIMPNRRTYLIHVSRLCLGVGTDCPQLQPEDLKALARDERLSGDRRHFWSLGVRPLGRMAASHWAKEQLEYLGQMSDQRAELRMSLFDDLWDDRPMTRNQNRKWEWRERKALEKARLRGDLQGSRHLTLTEEHNRVIRHLAHEIMDGGL